jgi:hypothetical protein
MVTSTGAQGANNEARANLAAQISGNQEANDKPRWTRYKIGLACGYRRKNPL